MLFRSKVQRRSTYLPNFPQACDGIALAFGPNRQHVFQGDPVKYFFLIILVSISSTTAFADWGRPGWGGGRPGWGGGRPGWGGGPGYGRNITCQAYDNGWEEHWGGHSSCQECRSKHGGCYERCTCTSYHCTAQGNDPQGRQQTFEAFGEDQWRTRDEASQRCYYRGLMNCRVINCDTNEQEVSRRGC